MARLQLLGGSDVRRSVLASGQRCENLYPEKNADGSAAAETLYQRPGLRLLGTASGGQWRGLWQCTAFGRAFGVTGNLLVEIGQDFSFVPLGTLPDTTAPRVALQDNRTTLFIAQGQEGGFTLDLGTAGAQMQPLVDPDGFFTGADGFAYLDTFVVWNTPGSNTFQSSLSNQITPFDDTYVAAITSSTGNLTGLAVNRGNLILVAEWTTEIWTDAGAASFPFARVPSASLEHGSCAKYSIVVSGEAVYWLGQDRLGLGHIFRLVNYRITIVSDRGVELVLSRLPLATLAQAMSYAHQNDGHRFVVFTFPGTPWTWVFDELTEQWHRRTWQDPATGLVGRERLSCAAVIHGQTVGGDWENGNLYALDNAVTQDNGLPIRYVRTFPHISSLPGPQGPQSTDGHQVEVSKIMVDLEVGTVTSGLPNLILRYSSDRGKTFGQDLLAGTGAPGEFETAPTWRVLGRARDMVFEVEWAYAGQVALQGAWIDAEILDQ